MIYLLLYWAFLSVCFFISGKAIVELLKKVGIISNTQTSIFQLLLFGVVFSTTFAAYASLFFPLHNSVLFAYLTILFGCAVFFRKSLQTTILHYISVLKSTPKLFLAFASIVCILSFTLILLICFGDSKGNDDGLYYMQFIKWMTSYPVVPGLSNLHFRFGTNSHWHVLGSLFAYIFSAKIYFDDLNGWIFLLSIFLALSCLRRIWTKKHSLSDIIGLGILIPITISTWQYQFTALQADVPVLYFVYYLFVLVFKEFESNRPFHHNNPTSVFILLLPVFLITIKLSALVFILVSFIYIYTNFKLLNLKKYGQFILIAVIIVSPWFIRNVYLSGYLIHHIPSIDLFNVDWKVPAKVILDEKSWIHSWAILPYLTPAEVAEIPVLDRYSRWFDNLLFFYKIVLIGFVPSLIVLFFWLKSIKNNLSKKTNQLYPYIIIVFLFFIISWFISAPDVRFVFGILLFLNMFLFAKIITYAKNAVGFICSSFIIGLYVFLVSFGDIKHVIKNTFTIPVQNNQRNIDCLTKTNENGFDLYYSINSQKDACNCWGSKLPCTPYESPYLRLRTSKLKDGFYLKMDE